MEIRLLTKHADGHLVDELSFTILLRAIYILVSCKQTYRHQVENDLSVSWAFWMVVGPIVPGAKHAPQQNLL